MCLSVCPSLAGYRSQEARSRPSGLGVKGRLRFGEGPARHAFLSLFSVSKTEVNLQESILFTTWASIQVTRLGGKVRYLPGRFACPTLCCLVCSLPQPVKPASLRQHEDFTLSPPPGFPDRLDHSHEDPRLVPAQPG